LAPFLEQILTRHLDELALTDEGADELRAGAVDSLQDEILDLLARAEGLDEADPKLEALRGVINSKQSLANNKLMVFSSFRHTLACRSSAIFGQFEL
jgi:ERCC4-related helicase